MFLKNTRKVLTLFWLVGCILGSTAKAALPVQLQGFLIYPQHSKDKNWNQRINTTLRRLIKKKTLVRYRQKKSDQAFKGISADETGKLKSVLKKYTDNNLIMVKMYSPEPGLIYSSLYIYDQRMKLNLKKISQNNKSFTENLLIIKGWLTEYLGDLPLFGKLISQDQENFTIEFPGQVKKALIAEKNFQVYCLNKSCREINNAPPEGIIYSMAKGVPHGHIYSKLGMIKSKDLKEKNYIVIIANSRQSKMEKSLSISDKNIENSPSYNNSLRSCFTLPFTGNSKNLQKIRKKLMNKIENDSRCIDKSNPKIIKTLSKYSRNLREYLKNPEVLKTIAYQAKVGTFFKVHITQKLMGTIVELKVIGQNGYDVYFSKSSVLSNFDENFITSLLYEWILKYIESLPLDAVILESVSKNILFDLGVRAIHSNKQHFQVMRPYKLILFNKGNVHSAKWEARVIATGVIHKVEKEHSLGYILKIDDPNTEIVAGDWVKLRNYDKLKDIKPVFIQHNIKSKRHRFRLNTAFDISQFGSGATTQTVTSLHASTDLYLPYGWVGHLEGERSLDNINDFSFEKNNFRSALGYSKIVSGNVLVSLLELYAGFLNTFIPASKLNNPLVGDLTYKGFYASLISEIPIYDKNLLNIGLLYSPLLELTNTVSTLGKAKEVTFFQFFTNIDYQYTKKVSFYGELSIEKYLANMTVDDTKINVNKSKFRLGIRFNF